METYNDENDAFNWEAAVAAMEHMSLIPNRPKDEQFGNVLKETMNQNRKGTNREGTSGTSNPQTKVHQKTMLSFVQRYTREPAEAVMRPHSEYEDPAATGVEGIEIDPISAKTWVYPVNVPMRDYQYSIVQTALFTNTLVSLPTGLGKTLIAAVVMYNFFRWFPSGKIVFTAPSRPLVLQQIEACHDSVGIPQDWTIDMTGQMNPAERAGFWKTKRVFFVTPQVLEKDIHSGSCPMQELVCLVVDEAHRATGNYSYCIVVRKLMEASIRLRILALTATPGSKQTTIQAVVDNLRMSCLEYRSESDTDVRQYVHSKKIELLQVAMDSESLKIKDLFLEVLQPLVNKLCGLGVFYSRDAARLTPYEFLTARDKFRQAPPSGLDQRQYGDVEACFAAIITLYHIFKLLFSHGIRPAFEMLKQKLQSGPFARLMGRNENLQQIKSLMQKHVGNGASSPKLLKLQELISEHFKKNDPAKTRVIIFTNFRESVKDILETLQKLGDTIKAMEFIGQSSGKSSKGQSQKVQQSVLQKFRAGGFNTIVATSIAEEGLDIMEVDLVICFDANISPLRMIQRMGRTGRKRDGRVIVLASEGAELQGYLKKQAKSKVLSKHMHNGGLRSFNFHSSPRMVPHSFKPEVQLLELSIVKFVPRIKNKQKPVETFDPGVAALTVEELLTLRRYVEPSQPAAWRPSLIAFPHCQLLASRVHKVKHSVRTVSMLVDTLQLLRQNSSHRKHDEQALNVMEVAIPKDTQGNENKALSFISHSTLDAKGKADELDSEKGEELLEEARCSGRSLLSEQHEWTCQAELPCSTHCSPVNPKDLNTSTHALAQKSMLEDIVIRPQPVNTKKSLAFNSPSSFNVGQKLFEPDFHDTDKCLQESGPYGSLSPFKHHELIGQENEWTPANLCVPVNPDFHNTDKCLQESESYGSLSPFEHHELIGQENAQMPANQCLPVNSKMSTAFDHPLPQHCIFEGIVSVDSGGYVQVTSPPTLPFKGQFKHSLCMCADNAFKYNANLKVSSLSPSKLHETLDLDTESNICHGMDQLGVAAEDSTSTPIREVRHIVTSTPEEKILKVSGVYGQALEHDENNLDNDSPRLCSLAEQGIVPSSPCLDHSSVQKELEVANTSNLFDGFTLHDKLKWDVSRCKHPLSNSRDMYQEACTAVRSPSKIIPVSQKNKKVLDDDLRRVIDLNNSAHASASTTFNETTNIAPTILADGKAANVPRVLSLSETTHIAPAVLDDGKAANTPRILSLSETTHVAPPVLDDGKAANVPRVLESPLCPCSRRSSSGNWRLSLEAMSSVDKPRKLKRLRKVQNRATKGTVKPSSLVHHEHKGKAKKSTQVEAGLGKQRLHSAAAVLVDEEAEVSTDEAVSTDEDDAEDEEGSLEDFIDDRPEPTVASQSGASEPVDMMAVYRKSLLTQSPLDGDFGPWTRFLKPNSTPLSGHPDSLSTHKSEESKFSDFSNSHEKAVVGSRLTAPAGSFLVTPCLGSHSTMLLSFDSNTRQTKENNTSGKNNGSGELPNDSQSVTKLQGRKRKLSFQQQGVPPNFEISDVAGNFDDDIFVGVDLDALEVEAAQLSRSQFQANVSQPVVAIDADIHRIGKGQICKHVDIGHEDFECFPSFNLGIDC